MRSAPGLGVAALVAAALLLAGCGGGARASEPTWRPQPSFQGEGELPDIKPAQPPVPTPSKEQPRPSRTSPSPTGAPSSSTAQDPAVVATKLAAPTGIALLPDGTALVGERTTGRIVRVQPRPGQPVQTVRTLPGIDASGDGGLLDLALSPHYLQDNLIFAYVTTATDNRVVAFTLTGPVTPVISGIPKGRDGNTGRIAFGPDNRLYVGTGDTGSSALAEDPGSLAGKVLRLTDIGEPAPGNPTPSSPIFTSGHGEVDGLCADARSQRMLEVEAAPDEVNALVAGESYGSNGRKPVAAPPTQYPAPGGCAVLDGVLYLTSLGGDALLAARLSVKGGTITVGRFEASLQNRYGRLRTVVAAPDGALWLTTSNRDGNGRPIPDDERVLRIVPSGGGATAPV
jgi:glucose/arabinose dehydrogenase